MARTQRSKRHSKLEGLINPDEPFATKLGFNSEEFYGYLWKDGKEIWIPFIVSKVPGQGNMSRLFRRIEALGYKIIIPTPLDAMLAIISRMGFQPVRMPWASSPDFEIDPGNFTAGRIWERHKMGLKLQGLVVPPGEQVEVWTKP